MNKYLTDDFALSKEEGQELLKLLIGLDQKNSSGYSTSVAVLEQLKTSDPEGYREVCYEIGNSFLFYYDAKIDRDRYSNATKWFKEARDSYSIAGVYCDISQCLELINQYNGSKIKQTQKMYEEYERLWNMLGQLKTTADGFEEVDSKMQVWNEINTMIDSKVAALLEVTESASLTALLESISNEAAQVNKSILKDDIAQLQTALQATIQRIASANA